MLSQKDALGKQAIIHQVTTMLVTSKHVLFPGHNHLLTTVTDDTLIITPASLLRKGSSLSGRSSHIRYNLRAMHT